jgi:hypothetical protein
MLQAERPAVTKRFPWFVVALCFAATLCGQEYRGTFSGSVADAQGAAIPKAKVAATETETGNKSETTTSATGEYTIPFLKPGAYKITAEAPGFKQFVRQGLTLATGEHPVIDIRLEVGEMTQAVTITGEAPMLESSNASAGEVITAEEVEEMPINGRTAMMLSRLALGVLSTNEPGPVRPFDNAAAASFTMSGAPAQANEMLLNGAPDGTWDKRLAYSPPQDAVVEVRVQSFESDAAYGHSGGGTVNVNTKGGTNSLHGSLYEFNQVSLLEANAFFTNKNGVPRPAYHYNQYGATSGGPVWIPKLFHGKNRMFWFVAYEALKDSDPANAPTEGGPTVITVPTAAERTGDFSGLLKANTSSANYQLYDPLSGVTAGSRTNRTPFANNVIPTSRLNPIALNYLQWYPLPNVAGRADGFGNYGVVAPDSDTGDNELARLDLNLSSKSKLSMDFRHNNRYQIKNNHFRNLGFGQFLHRTNWGTTVDEVYTVSPTMVLDIRANWTRFIDANNSPSDGFDPTTIGFPPYIAANSQFKGLPYMQFGTCTGTAPTSYQCQGMTGDNDTPFDIYQLFGSVVKFRGNHSLKMGGDLRSYRASTFAPGYAAGTYTFSTNWTKGPQDNSTASPFGQDFASFLLGLPTSGSYDMNTHSSQKASYAALFVQDDWRAKPGLTINLGLRWEHEAPVSERWSRTASGFDPTAANPIAAAAAAAYALKPIAQIPAGQFKALGGLTFASPGHPDAYTSRSHLISPRAGFAWVPKALGSRTVIRGGFGIFVTPISLSNGLALNQEGFSQTTQYVVTNNNYLSPAGNISNPFPNGILNPAPSNSGTFLGQQVKFFNPHVRNPYSMRWNFGIQRQLPAKLVLEVVYIGNHTVRQFITDTNLNPIPRQYLSRSPNRDQPVINLLSGSVTNPFLGLLPNSSSLNGSTVALSQLLLPFPQFPSGSGVDMQDNNAGESYFHSLNVRLQKRLTHGMTLINNFMYSGTIERITYLNDTDPAPEKRVSGDSRPLRDSMGMSYELPIGRGKLLDPRSRVVKTLAAGWALNGMLTFQSGPPLSWGNDDIYYGGPLHLNAHQPDGPAFDTTQFNTVSNQQLSNHIRTFDTYFNNLRRDPTKNLDVSLLKRFTLGERKYLQLRFESFNTTNRVTFAAPAQLNPTNSAFGLISSQANNPRKIQLGARLVW